MSISLSTGWASLAAKQTTGYCLPAPAPHVHQPTQPQPHEPSFRPHCSCALASLEARLSQVPGCCRGCTWLHHTYTSQPSQNPTAPALHPHPSIQLCTSQPGSQALSATATVEQNALTPHSGCAPDQTPRGYCLATAGYSCTTCAPANREVATAGSTHTSHSSCAPDLTLYCFGTFATPSLAPRLMALLVGPSTLLNTCRHITHQSLSNKSPK